VSDPSPDRVAHAQQLRSDGLLWREIAERLGVSPRTIARWTSPERAERDRQRSREAKHTRRRPCERCSRPISYDRAGGLCSRCGHDDAQARVQQVAALYETGREPLAIARQTGLSASYIRTLLSELARNTRVEPRWTLRDRPTVSERDRQFLALKAQGRSRRQIAEQLGLTYGSLSTVAARLRERESARPAA
jgi:transposase